MFKITKEGYSVLVTFGILTILAMFSHFKFLAYIFFILFLFSAYFFRDPERFPPRLENVIVSPADGRILKIEEIEDNYKISIFMGLFDVHINRAPISGKIIEKKYQKGKFFNASLDKASEENERMEYLIQTENFTYKLSQIAGIIARRIVSYINSGDYVNIGEKIGMIKFGSRAEIVVPKKFVKVIVSEGQKVYAGETIIGLINLGEG